MRDYFHSGFLQLLAIVLGAIFLAPSGFVESEEAVFIFGIGNSERRCQFTCPKLYDCVPPDQGPNAIERDNNLE
jgi:hypothetical protein